MIVFQEKIRGKQTQKETRLSITIKKRIADEHNLKSGDFVKVRLEDCAKVPRFNVEFRKRIAKAGSEGTMIYLPKKIVVENELRLGMYVLVKLEEFY